MLILYQAERTSSFSWYINILKIIMYVNFNQITLLASIRMIVIFSFDVLLFPKNEENNRIEWKRIMENNWLDSFILNYMIFVNLPDSGIKPASLGLLHWRAGSLPLGHLGSPFMVPTMTEYELQWESQTSNKQSQ